MASEIKDINLAPSGEKKIEWVKRNCDLLRTLEEEFTKTKPFAGKKVALSVHLEAKTAYLCKVLAAGGAEMYVTGSNPLSTQDDVAAALVKAGLEVHAWHGTTPEEYESHIRAVLSPGPNIIIDDGGDLVHMVHTEMPELIPGIIGGCEETTTGILRLRAMDRDGELKFPMVLVNNAQCKHFFDNRYGTGQSVWDGINRTTNLIVAGKIVVVAGYGWCGKGVAMRAKGLGARVIVTEINPVKAIEAVMDGFDVMPMKEAAKYGDFFVTVTGCDKVIDEEDFVEMKDGAGRLVNLACGDGHPAEIMDMSFAIQALSAKYLVEHEGTLDKMIIDVPDEEDVILKILELLRGTSLVNIHVNEENREDINGILQISFKNVKDLEHAKTVISENTDYNIHIN